MSRRPRRIEFIIRRMRVTCYILMVLQVALIFALIVDRFISIGLESKPEMFFYCLIIICITASIYLLFEIIVKIYDRINEE